MIDARIYKPTVAWETYIRDVVLTNDETTLTPAIYRLKVVPININNPGADLAEKQVGFYIQDYIGHYYRITEINISGDSSIIKVSDDFRYGECPQTGQIAVLFKSVGEGTAPYLTPFYSRHLSRSAMDENIGIDHDILWRNGSISGRVEFLNTQTPSLLDYQINYSAYGDIPKFVLITYDSEGIEWERQEVPIRNYTDGLLDSIVWDLSDIYSGYIIISK